MCTGKAVRWDSMDVCGIQEEKTREHHVLHVCRTCRTRVQSNMWTYTHVMCDDHLKCTEEHDMQPMSPPGKPGNPSEVWVGYPLTLRGASTLLCASFTLNPNIL